MIGRVSIYMIISSRFDNVQKAHLASFLALALFLSHLLLKPRIFEWNDSEEALLNQPIFRILPDEEKVNKRYLRHGLEGAILDMQKHLHGATMQHVNRGEFLSTKLYLPPLEEQGRIAEVLDRAEELRSKRREAIAQLDILTQAIFLEMFGDPVVNPKGWLRKSIKEIGEVITGNTPSRANPDFYGTAIEWIKSDNINTPHYYLTQAEEGLSELGKAVARTAPAGSILVTCIAGTLLVVLVMLQ